MAGRFLTLSLFVVLLSFFIVLNSMSTFENRKAQIVANKVSEAFTRKVAALDASDPDASSKFDDSLMAGTTLDRIEGVFTEQIAGLKAVQNRLGTIMYIEMTTKQFEQFLSNASVPQIGALSQYNLIKTLVTLMDAQNTAPYRMDIVLNTVFDPAKVYHEDPLKLSSLLRRASGYADQLETLGLPSRLVTSGVRSGQDGMVSLIFRRYVALNLATKTQIQQNTQTPPAIEEGGVREQ